MLYNIISYNNHDEIAMQKPNNIAMIWCNDQGEEHIFTFKDIKEKSDKAAAYFSSLGIKKGDFVMLILKRHYQFWFAIMGLCKIGAVVIPATNQLMVKDLVYRLNSPDVCAVVCTADGEISDNVDLAQAECPTLKHKIITRGHKFG
jgi:acetyl-CoA synthetase